MHGGIDEYQASGPALGMFATAYTVPFNAQTVLETFDLQAPGSSTSSLLSGILLYIERYYRKFTHELTY